MPAPFRSAPVSLARSRFDCYDGLHTFPLVPTHLIPATSAGESCANSTGSASVKQPKTAVVVGAQWGDEGKGKIVDVLSEQFSLVARYAGGHNAGHTVIINERKFILQLIPCGILRHGCRAVIGNGVVLDPMALLKEVAALRSAGLEVEGPGTAGKSANLFVSNRAQVILPYHRMIELAAENAPGRVKIGTTSRGIGPAYEDKMGRSGLRVVDLLDLTLLKKHIENACAEKNMIAHALFNTEPLDPDTMYEQYAKASEQVRPFVCDTAALLNRAINAGEPVMFEGAQGTMLDIDHGTYPFVTSSSATSGGAATGTGVPPNAISTVIGITKAYCTRVGEGPFPTELHNDVADQLRARGQEYGAVTGRPRRVGWLDLPLLRYSKMINGISWLVVTKLDVLDELAEIPVCVAYKMKGKKVADIPADASGFERLEPVYETLPGWHKSTIGVPTFEKLPSQARAYLNFIAAETNAKIGMVSTGPDRDQTLFMPGFVDQIGVKAAATLRKTQAS
ncbi:MAG: adenylosuccinate synthase [Acidobacteriaceae bacterium]|nr:adenylosuccinate synthase [Acidobacteriaceae bacterium]